MVISFNVEKQIVTRTDKEKVVRLSRDYLYAHFEFSEEWIGTKTAVFKYRNKAYNMILDSEGTCLVPWEILKCEYFDVSVFCGNLITANAARVFTIGSGYALGENSKVPTPNIYTQIIEKLDGIVAETIPYNNTQSGMGAENVQEALDELAAGGGGGGGVTPNISMTATVDGTTGTPDVEVTKTGTLNNPVFNLEFSGLKGEKGDDGSVVEVTQILSSGTKIAEIDVDGNTVNLFAPAGGASVVSDLTDVELTDLDDGDVLQYDAETQKWKNVSSEDCDLVNAVLAVDTMPTASEDYEGTTVIFIGTSTANYTKGHNYKCEADGLSYRWVELGSTGEPKIVHDDEGTEYTIAPNILHIFSEPKDTLTINFASPANENIVNDYHFIFESGETPTVLTLPSSVVMPSGAGNIPSNSILEVSIVENLAIVQSWPQS